jgi:hypothetical protein
MLPPSPRRRKTVRWTLGRPMGDRARDGRGGRLVTVCSGRDGAASGRRCWRCCSLLQSPRRHRTARRSLGRPKGPIMGGRICCCGDDRRRGGSRRSAWRFRRPPGSKSERPAAAGSSGPATTSLPAQRAAAATGRRHSAFPFHHCHQSRSAADSALDLKNRAIFARTGYEVAHREGRIGRNGAQPYVRNQLDHPNRAPGARSSIATPSDVLSRRICRVGHH